MSRLIVMIGISGSGKSTLAKTISDSDPKAHLIVNRDKIRELLFGYTESNISEYYRREDMYRCEKEVTKYEGLVIRQALTDKKTVIIDATHLRLKYLESFKNFNVEVEYIPLDVDLEVCYKRVQSRTRKIDREILEKQYKQFLNLKRNTNFETFCPDNTESVNSFVDWDKPKCTIFDIDGTLAKMDGRSPFDWSKVGSDLLNVPVYNAYLAHKALGSKIIICTGRDGSCALETETWLSDHSISYEEFHIREENDCRKDWIIKEEMWRDISKRYCIMSIYDDRDQVVHHARSLGIAVFQVAYGNF